MAHKFCPFCGGEIEKEDYLFCPSCGKPLTEESPHSKGENASKPTLEERKKEAKRLMDEASSLNFVSDFEKRMCLQEEAMSIYAEVAESGDLESQKILGNHYSLYWEKSLHWYGLAAKQGDPEAIFKFFEAAESRFGNDKEKMGQAIAYLSMAAEQGCGYALYLLGWAYEFGIGVEPDLAKAISWYTRCASLPEGDIYDASTDLGIIFATAEGEFRDPKQAKAWFDKAMKAEPASYAAKHFASLFLEDGAKLPSSDTDRRRLMAERLDWKADGLMKRPGIMKDFDDFIWIKMIDIYTALAEQGDLKSQKTLGYIHGEINNEEESLKWYGMAAEQGDIEAMYYYSDTALDSSIEDPEIEKRAWNYLLASAESGYHSAEYLLATIYKNEDGEHYDMMKAIYWYEKADASSDADDYGAAYRLANIYHLGRGVPVDLEKALHWYKVAKSKGYNVDSMIEWIEDELSGKEDNEGEDDFTFDI